MINKQSFSAILVLMFLGTAVVGVVGQAPNVGRNMVYAVQRLETNMDQFRDNVRNDLNNEPMAVVVESRIAGLERATDRLRDRVESNDMIPADVHAVLRRAMMVERTVQPMKLSADTRADWMRVRADLDALAGTQRVRWAWTMEANPYWKSPGAAEEVVDDLENSADQFRRSFDHALDSSVFNGTKTEDRAIELANDFESQIDRWEDLADNERLTEANVRLLLQRAAAIETFMGDNKINMPRAWRDWMQVRNNLDTLMMMANVQWTWGANPTLPPLSIR